MKRTSILLLAALTFAACQKNETPSTSNEGATLYATIEETASTKTYMDANNNTRWSEGDQVVAFMKTSLGLRYEVAPSSVGKTSAHFDEVGGNGGGLNAGTEWDHNIVYYPYSESIEAAKSGNNYVLNTVLPSEQNYAAGSFGNGSMAMVAVSKNNNITFRNVLGGMKLQLKGTQKVASIILRGKNNEKLSGAATVTAYTDATKPAITMAESASTSVTLDCGSGVQLNESSATEFILALPPVVFTKGFTVTVIDTESNTYTVGTDKANTVLRSSLLVMPAFKLGYAPVDDESGDNDLEVPVMTITLSYSILKLYEGDHSCLTATIKPKDATCQTIVWSSSNPAIATVDNTGLVSAISTGTALIYAVADGIIANCTVVVSPLLVAADYIDEYGVNHGKGTAIGMTVWAPVNCGYHTTDYQYGKLYQWGRKYGQGYSGQIFDNSDAHTYSDASVPIIKEGGISLANGTHTSNSNVFFASSSDFDFDWVYPQNDKLWNYGTEDKPVKTEYDPCPNGWRVPTYIELKDLSENYSTRASNVLGQLGLWFSGPNFYSSEVPQLFLPAAGYLTGVKGIGLERGYFGNYWSSKPESFLFFTGEINGGSGIRANGFSVRCVQE